MKKHFKIFVVLFLVVSCNSTTSKIENAVIKLDNRIERIENLIILEEYDDSWRSPSDKGTTYKFIANFVYKNGDVVELKKEIFIADKDGMVKWK